MLLVASYAIIRNQLNQFLAVTFQFSVSELLQNKAKAMREANEEDQSNLKI